MKTVAIRFVAVGVALATVTHALRAADAPSPARKPAGTIVITNKSEGSASNRSPYLSAGLPDVLKLHKAGVDPSVLLAFVQNSPVAFHPSAKEILYLREQGVSSEIISAVLRRGGELRERAAEAAREERSRATPPPAAPISPPAQPAPPPQAAAPTTTVVYANPTYPAYTCPTHAAYPVYGYSYASPAYYGYSYCRPYYRSAYYPSYYAGYRSGCYPSYYSGYRSGCSSGWGGSVGYRGGYYGHGGGYRYAGGWRGGGGYCRR
jgi:hypothetical protein